MDEQPKEVVEEKKQTFFQKYSFIFSAACAFIAMLFLLGTIVKLKLKIPTEGGEEIKQYVNVHLWDYFTTNYAYNWTIYVILGLLTLGIVFVCLSKIKKTLSTAASMTFILAIPMIALVAYFYASNEVEYLSSVSFGWGSVCSLAFTIAAAVLSLSTDFISNPIVTREIAEDGILIAAAFILNIIKIPLAAGAGSINFQMLPLFIIALRHGPMHGLVCGGIVYGLLTCITDGYGFACYPFDYLIGFGSVMVMGYFSKFILSEEQKNYNVKGEIFLFVSALIATFIRFVGSTASSMIIYKLNFGAALQYNFLYVSLSGLVAIAVLMAAYGPILKVHHRFPVKKSL